VDALNLIQADLIAGVVVEFGRLGRLMGRDLLGVLQGAPVEQVGSDAGGPEGVATDVVRQPGLAA